MQLLPKLVRLLPAFGGVAECAQKICLPHNAERLPNKLIFKIRLGNHRHHLFRQDVFIWVLPLFSQERMFQRNPVKICALPCLPV
jgi:hypothetical protein